ncbi:serine protease Hayan-like [Contarinia nasturtii]|uniref:serine protease Hayan-like n=1 Tax=Contarinia nasturtii TaxID=265458 RepID=UPI0012D45A1A|nr:serine protease Hayan-like [Contarinia nasturtii]
MMKVRYLFAVLFFFLEAKTEISDLDQQLLGATKDGRADAVKTLIDHGANVNVEDKDKYTPLQWAALLGRLEVIKTLIENRANVNVEDKNKRQPIHLAAWSGHTEAIKTLIDHGANVSAEDIGKSTPLHFAAAPLPRTVTETRFSIHTPAAGKINMIKLLIEKGANTSSRNIRNETPRSVALKNGFKEEADLLGGMIANVQNISFMNISATKMTAKDACNRIRGNQSIEERILDGDIANNGEFPWMAALGYNDNYKISFGCGGTIISEYYIMTAAHCCAGRYPPVLVRVGKVSLNDVYTDETRATNYYIKSITRHPSYSVMTKKNDIALLELTLKIAFSNAIRPACLYTNIEDVDTATKLIVTGWGNTNPNRESQSNDLRKIAVNTKPLNECNRTYLNYNILVNLASFRDGIDPGQYCAFDPAGEKDSCQGDSGGPLQYILNNDPNTVTIVGIVSAGIACGADLPSLYTRVAYYIPWIESIVWP